MSKRAFDLAVCLLALWVRLDSPGSALFVRQRVRHAVLSMRP